MSFHQRSQSLKTNFFVESLGVKIDENLIRNDAITNSNGTDELFNSRRKLKGSRSKGTYKYDTIIYARPFGDGNFPRV